MISFKIKLSILFSLFILLFSAGAYANQASPAGSKEFKNSDSLYEVKSVDDATLDLGKRFILSTLGKDALIYFLPNGSDLQTEIRGLTDGQMELYSRPFNHQMISGTLVMFSTAFLVAFVTILIYVIWIYLETIMRSQESGSFIGDDWSKYFTPVKIVVGFTLVYPFIGKSHEPFKSLNEIEGGSNLGSFSIAQYIVLKTAGYSNESANKIYGEYIRTTPIFYPTVKMPNISSKSQYAFDLMDFMFCAKTSHAKDEEISIVRNKDTPSSFNINITAGRCILNAEIGYDSETGGKIDQNPNIAGAYSSDAYESKQKELMLKSINATIAQANKIVDKIITTTNTDSRQSLGINTYDNNDWAAGCDIIDQHIHADLNKKDLMLMYSSASKCLSKTLVETLTPATKSFDYIFGTDNYLDNGYIELCNHDENQDNFKQRTAIKYLNFDTNLVSKNKDLLSCISETCNAGNLMECSTAIGVASQLEDRELMAKQGWITAGANAYILFKSINAGYGRGIVNRSNFVFEEKFFNSSGFEDTPTKNAIDIFKINMPMSTQFDFPIDYNTFLKFKSTFASNYIEALQTIETAPDVTPDGWFGTKKFQYCIEHPMEVSGGYVCGNITEEMHQLGSKLLALGLQLKSIAILAKSIGIQKEEKKDTAKSGGKISGSKTKELAKKFFLVIMKVLDGVIPAALTGWFLYETGVGNDAFTDNNGEVFKQYPEIISFIAGSAAVGMSISDINFMSTVLDLAVFTLIPLGILFGFILPLIPLAFSMIVVAGFIVQIMIGLLLSNIWGVVLMKPSNDHSSSASTASTKIIVSMLLKAPLSVAGLIIAWTLNNTLISEIMQFADIGQSLAFKNNDIIRNFIDQFVILIVYFLMVYGMYNIIFSLIEGFHEIAIDTLFSGKSVSPFANKSRGDDWKAAMDTTKNVQAGK